MRALDLFCGGGGTTKGLQRAGFIVVGVDIDPQPKYCGVHFIQADALKPPVKLEDFDFIWASPPCQRFSTMTKMWKGYSEEWPDLIAPIREMLIGSGKPYCIENVPNAPLNDPVVLCGSSFGLGTKDGEFYLRRHRLFEANFPITPLACSHGKQAITVCGNGGGFSNRDKKHFRGNADRQAAMGIDWLYGHSLSEAVPPAYSEYIAREFLRKH